MPHPVRHLAVETTRLLRERRGIGRYVRNVLRELTVQQPQLQFTLFVQRTSEIAAMRDLLDGLYPGLGAWARIEPIGELARTDADIVWYPWNQLTVPHPRATMIATVHDLAPMHRHDHRWWKVLKRAKYHRRYARTLARAHGILTISEFSRREVLDRFDVPPDKVSVTLLAADDLTLSTSGDMSSLDRAACGAGFFLSVGGQEARKNLTTLYTAMDRLWARGIEIPLVQCGPGLSRETRARRAQAPWLRHLGYVTDAQLVTLYRHATALVFPSRYEGFGLPVLEAMRAGGVVVCSTASSLPEVAGNAALTVPWDDAEALAHAMQRVYDDATLRAQLQAGGPLHAAAFSWARTASETFSAMQRAVATHRASTSHRHTRPPFWTRVRTFTRSLAPLAPTAVVRAASRLHDAFDR